MRKLCMALLFVATSLSVHAQVSIIQDVLPRGQSLYDISISATKHGQAVFVISEELLLGSNTNMRAVITRYEKGQDNRLAEIWSAYFSAPHNDPPRGSTHVTAVAFHGNDGYLAGRAWYDPNRASDVYVARFNARTGEILNYRLWDGGRHDEVKGVAVSDSGVYIWGDSWGDYSAFLLHLSLVNLDIKNTAIHNTSGYERSHQVIATPNGVVWTLEVNASGNYSKGEGTLYLLSPSLKARKFIPLRGDLSWSVIRRGTIPIVLNPVNPKIVFVGSEIHNRDNRDLDDITLRSYHIESGEQWGTAQVFSADYPVIAADSGGVYLALSRKFGSYPYFSHKAKLLSYDLALSRTLGESGDFRVGGDHVARGITVNNRGKAYISFNADPDGVDEKFYITKLDRSGHEHWTTQEREPRYLVPTHSPILDGQNVYASGFYEDFATSKRTVRLVNYFEQVITETGDLATENVPALIVLRQNYPNPAKTSGKTTIEFELKSPGHVQLAISNVLGQKVRVLKSGHIPGGTHSVVWDVRTENGEILPSGTYFCVLEVDDERAVKAVTLVK